MASGTIPKSVKATLYIDGKPAEQSIKAVEQTTRSLERELKNLTIGTDAWNTKMKEVSANKKYLKEVRDEVNGVGGAFNKIKSELGSLGTLAAGYLGFQFIEQQFQQMITSSAKLSDSLADIRRNAGLTESEVLSVYAGLKNIDTRTSLNSLRDIANIAGKLGVAKDGIVSFTTAVDKLVVSLGDELGNADEITTQLGKILNVFDGKVTGENITTLGNAVISLANAGVASAPFVVDFTQRISGIAKTANLSLASTLGLAAGLEELGQRSESSATAISKLLTDIGTDLPKAAKIAGLSVKDFQQLFANAPQEALIKYAEGLTKNKKAFSDIATAFEQAGEEGARVISSISAIGSQSELMRKKIELGNNTIKDATQINNAFALKNETLGATLDKISKWFYGIATSNFVTGTLNSLASGFAKLIGLTKTVTENLEGERFELIKVGIQINSTNTSNENRIKLINELKSKYPELLGFLSAEKASQEDVAKAIKLVNDQLVNKIILSRQDAEIEKENNTVTQLQVDKFDAEAKMIERLVKLRDKYPKIKIVGDNEVDQLKNLAIEIGKIEEKQRNVFAQGAFSPTAGIGKMLSDYKQITNQLTNFEIRASLANENKFQLMKKLGIKDLQTTTTSLTNPSPSNLSTPKTQQEIDAAKKAADQIKADGEKLKDELAKIANDITKNQLEGYDKEVFEAGVKYEKLTELAHGNKDKLAEIYTAEYKEIEAIGKKFQDAAAVKAKKEYQDKLDAFGKFQEDIYQESLNPKQKEESTAANKYEVEWLNLIKFKEANIITEAQFNQREKEAQEQLQKDLLNIKKKYRNVDLTDEEKYSRDKKNFQLDTYQLVANTGFTILRNAQQASANEAISGIEKQRQVELANKNLTEEQKKKINDKFDAQIRFEKIRAWKAEQRAAIAQAVINGALAITKVLAQTGVAAPFVIPSIIAATSAELLIIAAQKAPKFAGGGLTSSNPAGYTSGPTLFTNSASGRDFIAGEAKTEWIAPNWMVTDPRFSGIINTLEIARQEKRAFAYGGSTAASSSQAANTPNFVQQTTNFDTRPLEDKMDQFIAAAKNAWNYRTFEEGQAKVLKSRGDATA